MKVKNLKTSKSIMKRIGKISISSSFFNDKYLLDIIPVFDKFIPIHVEHRLNANDYVYTGYCLDFEELTDGITIPFYTCTLTKEKNNIIVSYLKS